MTAKHMEKEAETASNKWEMDDACLSTKLLRAKMGHGHYMLSGYGKIWGTSILKTPKKACCWVQVAPCMQNNRLKHSGPNCLTFGIIRTKEAMCYFCKMASGGRTWL